MRSQMLVGVGLAFALWTSHGGAQELAFRPVGSPKDSSAVTLGRPHPLYTDGVIQPASYAPPAATLSVPRPIVRGQSPDFPPMTVPPPPPMPGGPGGFGNPAVFPGGPAAAPTRGPGPGEEAYNCGLINNNADLGGFWTRTGERFRRCWTDITGTVGDVGRNRFQSDHAFDSFISPVTNPIFFEDPRSLTELRPVFIWQKTRDKNYVFAGGNNYFAVLQGRVALTENVSLVVNKLGWTFVNPEGGIPDADKADGFSELHLGPKITFLRNETSGTIAAIGMNFELPLGSKEVAQDTGNLSLSPYLSVAQNFWRSSYGSFNFMNTTGYSLGIDSKRSDFLYSSFHLDYNVMNANKFYPLVELNWTRYVFNGSARALDFEGTNLFNFGSMVVAGHNDLTLALGARYLFTPGIQLGIAGEMSVLGGGRHLDDFRLTVDMIFRY